MAMELEQVEKRRKSAWRMLFAGLLLGVLASALVFVVLNFMYGPCDESTSMDLYSGHVITYKRFL